MPLLIEGMNMSWVASVPAGGRKAPGALRWRLRSPRCRRRCSRGRPFQGPHRFGAPSGGRQREPLVVLLL